MPSVKKVRLSIAAAVIAAACVIGTVTPAGVAAADNVYVSIEPGETVGINIPINTYQQPTSQTVRKSKRTTTRVNGKPSKPVTSQSGRSIQLPA